MNSHFLDAATIHLLLSIYHIIIVKKRLKVDCKRQTFSNDQVFKYKSLVEYSKHCFI